jgi:8-oxo-dGTP pyrophosphatase MutT (NUDIX family)
LPTRCIHLRRPPTLLHDEVPYVPPQASLDEIDRRWQALCARNPAYHDGRVLHVSAARRNGCGGAAVHVADCSYRFHAVQDEAFDLGVRPLGVKGITRRDGAVLLGLRSKRVAHYQDMWEFAPAGVVESGRTPPETVTQELAEETGFEPRRDPVPVALVYDDTLRCWEIVFRIEVGAEAPHPRSDEYAELRWCAPDELPDDLSPITRQIAGLLPM